MGLLLCDRGAGGEWKRIAAFPEPSKHAAELARSLQQAPARKRAARVSNACTSAISSLAARQKRLRERKKI
jgi:hypothetical protein